MTAVDIQRNYKQIQERIAQTAISAGRDPKAVRLVVVTKGHGLDTVQEAITAGARHLGENYVEEAAGKIQACSDHPEIQWHMIGHIQSRKARVVSEYFHWLHSLDSLKLAKRLDRFSGEIGRNLPVLLECNVSGEQSKSGFAAWEEISWPDLSAQVEQILALPNLSVRGLMTMAPFLPDPEAARPYFIRLRRLGEFFAARFPPGTYPQSAWGELSMGMSADFEIAIQEGATLVRIGTAILGPRPIVEN